MPKKRTPKNEVVILHTDENGIETIHKIRTKILSSDLDTAIWWVKKATDHQEWEDNQPEAGMGSGCW